jgi:hypothetical protein
MRAYQDDPAGHRIGQAAAGGVVQGPVGLGVESVEAEVAPRRVLGPVGGEGHHGAAAVGLDVSAQGGDLERAALGHRGDGAVLDPRRHGAQPGGLDRGDGLLWGEPGGDVDVLVRPGAAEQGVAHAAADETGAVRAAGRLQRRHHRAGGTGGGPVLRRKRLGQLSHRTRASRGRP